MEEVLNKRRPNFFPLLNMDIVLRNSGPGELAFICQSKWVGLIEIKIERTLRRMEHSLLAGCILAHPHQTGPCPGKPENKQNSFRQSGYVFYVWDHLCDLSFLGGWGWLIQNRNPKTRVEFNNSIKFYSRLSWQTVQRYTPFEWWELRGYSHQLLLYLVHNLHFRCFRN